MNNSIRIGQGFDIHKLVEGRKLILGGVEILHTKGLLGHSDADVLIHAIIDALLGAMGFCDIGTFFPDTDKKYKDADSSKLLADVVDMMKKEKYEIINIDSTIITEEPKLKSYIPQMKEKLSKILETDVSQIAVKAKTMEGLDAVGRGEGIIAQAVVLLNKN